MEISPELVKEVVAAEGEARMSPPAKEPASKSSPTKVCLSTIDGDKRLTDLSGGDQGRPPPFKWKGFRLDGSL